MEEGRMIFPWVHRSKLEAAEQEMRSWRDVAVETQRQLIEVRKVSDAQVGRVVAAIQDAAAQIVYAVNIKP
jgi:hypothetical protein